MQCAESLRVQAYFDAEVDALSASDIERHVEHCTECSALLKDLEQVRSVLRRDSAYVRIPPALRAKVMHALDQEGAADTTLIDTALIKETSPSSARAARRWRMRPV